METIDIHSKGEYPSNVLSNFYPNAFTFDGVECASMEGFLQSLKFRSRRRQKKVCALVGGAAKDRGGKKRRWKRTGNLWWKGKRYKRESAEFDKLRADAYAALISNQTFKAALIATRGKSLTHSIGGKDKKTTVLTVEEFISYLDGLREEIFGKDKKEKIK